VQVTNGLLAAKSSRLRPLRAPDAAPGGSSLSRRLAQAIENIKRPGPAPTAPEAQPGPLAPQRIRPGGEQASHSSSSFYPPCRGASTPASLKKQSFQAHFAEDLRALHGSAHACATALHKDFLPTKPKQALTLQLLGKRGGGVDTDTLLSRHSPAQPAGLRCRLVTEADKGREMVVRARLQLAARGCRGWETG